MALSLLLFKDMENKWLNQIYPYLFSSNTPKSNIFKVATVYKNLRKTMSLLSFYFLLQRNTAF